MAKVLQLASGAHLEFRPATPEEVEDWSSFYRKKNPKAQSEPKFEVLVWTPSPAMKDEVPEGFTFEMVCLHLPSGKRFFPFYPGEDMLRNAFTAGMAILISGQKLTPEQRSDMRIALLLYDRLASTRAKFNNSLERSRSLILTKCLRDIEAATDILPDHLGLDNQGESKKWGISKLLQKGREEAEKKGLQKTEEKDFIRLGLLVAARLAPFEAKVEQAESLLRLFLFEVPDGPGVSQETLEQVYKRLAPALEKHLEDEPEKFEGWFQGPKSSLLTGLAKQKKAPGGPMDRQMVARALQDLGWKATHALCLGAQALMADIRHGLKESGQINDEEERLFKAMNYRQDYLGGLNLHVLEGRLVQLLPGLDDIWHEEDPEKAGQVFLRLLEFYWRIAEKRREVDREFKARERLKKTLGFMPGVVPLEEPSEETSDHSDSENDSPRHWKAKRSKDQELETEEEKLIPMILQELAEDLRGHLQGKCGICPGEVMVEEVGEKVKFLLQCPVCLASKLIEAPLSDLQRKFRDLEQ